jgi:uncharacterized protein (TIGR02186 family)
MRLQYSFSTLFLSALLFLPGVHAAQPSESLGFAPLFVIPDKISINAFYKGTEVEIRSELPLDCDAAVVKIQGDDEEITLKRKGKVYIFWLNVDDITISRAPGIYILNSSAPLEKACSVDGQRKLVLGYDALKARIGIQGKNALSGSEFSDFITLKEHSGSYSQSSTAQLVPAADNKGKSLRTVLHIPPVMPSGDYQIQMYYFKDRTLLGESSAPLSVQKVGLPRYLYSLAFEHPAFYGVFACIIAMITGFIMSLIFGSRGRRKR